MNMKIIRGSIAAALLALCAPTANVVAATLSALNITGGSLQILNLDKSSVLLTYSLFPGSSAQIVMGSYQGAGKIVDSVLALGTPAVPLEELLPYTASSAGLYSGPFAAPYGITAGNTLSVIMDAWFVDSVTLGLYSGATSIQQGGLATGTLVGNAFTMSWDPDPHLTTGSISGPTRWTLSGTTELVAVPVPGAFLMLATGCAALLVSARRSKHMPAC